MPAWSKLDFCKFAAAWAGQDCPCGTKFDRDENDHHENGNVYGNSYEHIYREDSGFSNGAKSHEETMRMMALLFGPSNSQDVKDAASVAIRCYTRGASHDLAPQAILALQSLIRLDKSARAAATNATSSSNSNTPRKVKKPEILWFPSDLMVCLGR
ncbi:Light harvesting complex photosystem II subunit 6 [Hibiscus syriacus]|uniref:Light harvesting complex photosystem II subunit 6 n=1 Tax=Hibiscus syriacus TaxID=106335 RepID=A0A6A2XW71_HIBSY|nr:Light harvesting complex photosystem II subunit 6 [Hibiscus syriacus]